MFYVSMGVNIYIHIFPFANTICASIFNLEDCFEVSHEALKPFV